MSSADAASEQARAAAQARWGDTVIRRAISELTERRDRLDQAQRDALRFLADPEGQHDE